MNKQLWIGVAALWMLSGCTDDSASTTQEEPAEERATQSSEEAAPVTEETGTEEVAAEEEAAAEEPAVQEEPVVEEEPIAEEPPVEETPQMKAYTQIQALMEEGTAFDAGSYIQGDIPKGEYVFLPFEGSGQYYSEEDAAGNIIDNENFDSFGYVQVHEAGNLQTDGVLVSVGRLERLGVSGAKELYEIINLQSDYTDAGYYKVGVDLPAGTYVLESYGEGYVEVASGPLGNSEIIDNENFSGRYQVTVANGQYLKLSRAKISQ